jgi:hypothetical protein
LRFQDGQVAVARIEASSRHQGCTVWYSGAVKDGRFGAAARSLPELCRGWRAKFEEECLEIRWKYFLCRKMRAENVVEAILRDEPIPKW